MVKKSNRIRQTGHTIRMEDTEHTNKITVGIHCEQIPLEVR